MCHVLLPLHYILRRVFNLHLLNLYTYLFLCLFVYFFIYLTVLDPLCRDCVSSCDTWARRGLCTSKPVFMFGFCRLTCGLCYNSSSRSRCFGRVFNGCARTFKSASISRPSLLSENTRYSKSFHECASCFSLH